MTQFLLQQYHYKNINFNRSKYNEKDLLNFCKEENIDMIKKLLNMIHIDPNKLIEFEDFTFSINPLIFSVLTNKPTIVKILSEHERINPNITLSTTSIGRFTYVGFYSLAHAVISNYDEIVKILLKNKNINLQLLTLGRNNLLHDASSNNAGVSKTEQEKQSYLKIIRMLLETKKIDPNIPNAGGFNPIAFCIHWKNYECLIELLKDERTNRLLITPHYSRDIFNEEQYKIFNNCINQVKTERNRKFKGLVKCAIKLKRKSREGKERLYHP